MESSCLVFWERLGGLLLTRRVRPAVAALLLCLVAGAPASFADDYNMKETRLQGIASGGYTHSFQDTSLKGGSFDDGNGMDLLLGFQAGDYLAFQVGYQWQTQSDYDTHFFPVSVRCMSPSILDRVRLYGQFGLGLFYSQLHHELSAAQRQNARGAMLRLGGGVEVGITKNVSAIVYGAWMKGMGSTSDYESGTAGVGLQYRWDL